MQCVGMEVSALLNHKSQAQIDPSYSLSGTCTDHRRAWPITAAYAIASQYIAVSVCDNKIHEENPSECLLELFLNHYSGSSWEPTFT